MKKFIIFRDIALVIALSVLLLNLWGCSSNVMGLEAKPEDEINKSLFYSIVNAEDIKNLVTDGSKLVINYYDAYIWTVFFTQDDTVESMMYIYKFDSPEKANSMLESRVHELLRNRTVKVNDSKCVENYLLVELVDTSFDGISRDHLEINFSNLIVQ